ncbi:hypothetical protein K438DRAFT_169643 [Mycena galopus ATCC 62051]|nr:hypothetical protein K438DRAFT_169643 [Mycena galopus ATCC 62051]
MSFALTYGSFGDLLETARLAVKVVRFLRDGGKVSEERLAVAAELQTLNSDLVVLNFIASRMRLDASSTSFSVIIRIQTEVENCRLAFVQFLDKVSAPRGILGAILAALSEESELAKFRTQISRPLKAIGTLMSILNLAASQGVGLQVEHLGDRFDRLLTAYHETVLKLPIARGISDNIFCVVDPVGGNIPVSLRYCNSYIDLDRIIKAHLPIHRSEAGGRYVQRGDYNIVSGDGTIILPVEFTRSVQAGMQVEMSIIKRQIQNGSVQTQHTRCPHCHRSNANEPENDWFKCARCGRKYRIDVENPDTEEIASQMVALGRFSEEPELFRLVHIYTVFTSRHVSGGC